jgi:outer membrane protein TolC
VPSLLVRRLRTGALAGATVLLVAGSAHPLAAQAAAPPDSAPLVTLDDALVLARSASPVLANSAAAMRSAHAARLAVTGEYLPSLGVATSAARATSVQGASAVTNGIPVPSSMRALDDVYGTGIATSVPIYTGGRRGAERRSAAAQEVAASAGATAAEFDVRLATKQAYFAVLRAEGLVDVGRANVAAAQEALHDAEGRLRAGTSTRSDVLRARVTLANAEDALASAQAAEVASEYALGRTVGRDGPVRAAPVADEDSVAMPVSRDSVVALAVRAAPSARAAEASARAASAQVSAARAQYLPTVLASGGYGWLEQRAIDPHPVGGWTLQLGVSYPLFNNFQRESGVMRAEAQASAARVASEDAVRAARADAVSAYDGVTVAARRIALERDAVAAATEDLRVQQARYRVGASTFLDEASSEANLAQARTALVQARYDYQIARATLERVLGRPLDRPLTPEPR